MSSPTITSPEINGLIAAVSRNQQEGILGRFLEPHRWYALEPYLRPRLLSRGYLLISQGMSDRKVYFIESGSLKVDIQTESGFTELALLGPGAVAGEGSFFSRQPRIASVTAFTECKVWELSTDDFDALSREHPSVALALSMALGAILATRMLDMSKRIAIT
ncbi:MAG: cyclic nucleotide-binding domain-containing protein [Hylemonella sp.]|nr:cyclic nucleotide-binding domain-containing protein [Hylemonella sp.]MDH5707742.1 cyclic nucleotide-binding domain-containing protein [Hylemonella sp.]